jgi:hypothetical protein
MHNTLIIPLVEDKIVTACDNIVKELKSSIGTRKISVDNQIIIITGTFSGMPLPKKVVDSLLGKIPLPSGGYLTSIYNTRHIVYEFNSSITKLPISDNDEVVILYENSTEKYIEEIYHKLLPLFPKEKILFLNINDTADKENLDCEAF